MGIIREQTVGVLSTPPKFGCGLAVVGNIPNTQVFDATTGRYEPDYTLTPLTIDPAVAAINGDLPLAATDARGMLANIHWYEVKPDGTLTEITKVGTASTPVGYTVVNTTEGDPAAGRIQVAKNAAPGAPINLRFEADLLIGSDHFHIIKDIAVMCRDTTPAVKCSLDAPDIVDYNPIRDSAEFPVRLRVWENGQDAPTSHFIPVWEVRREDGSWSVYGDDITDYWMEIAADLMSAKIRLDLMGYGASVRVRLKYDRDGNPAAVTLAADDLSMPFCRLECVRNLGGYQHRLLGVTDSLMEWMTEISARVYVEDNRGEITSPERFFSIAVYACPAERSLTTADKVGSGSSVRIPTSVSGGKPMKVGYSVDELSPLLALTVNGTILTVGGSILLAKT